MATLKQIEANRLNAQRSTGPRSEAGQAASSQNSRRHGCYSSQVVIEGQDQEQFDQLLDEFMDELQPQTLRERNLVEMMAVEWWHLGQCEFMRRSFFSNQRKMVVDYHANWAEASEAERTNLVGENIAFYHLKDMNRISELKNRVFRSYHRASREFDRFRDERLRREAEAEAAEKAAVEAEPQPLPQLAEVNASEPAPESTVGSATQPAPAPACIPDIPKAALPDVSGETSEREPGGPSGDRPTPDLPPLRLC
jgi:hypothetical protein